jgi:hypothetical protein
MKKITIVIIIVSAIVIAAGSAAGGFFGGRAYERNQANTTRNNFLTSRGVQDFNPGVNPNGTGAPAGGFGGGATGQIKSIDGNTLTLTTARNETKVTLSETTRIEKSTTGALADLQAGQEVMVTGQRDSNGNITAVQVQILPATNSPAPAGTTP